MFWCLFVMLIIATIIISMNEIKNYDNSEECGVCLYKGDQNVFNKSN